MSLRIATSLATRMIAGAGTMTLAPHHTNAAPIEVLEHGLTDGRFLVACHLRDVAHLCDIPVRMELSKKAPEFGLDATVAKLSALGELEWIDSTDLIRFGVLHLGPLVLDGPLGPMPFMYSQLTGPEPAFCELCARDVVGRHQESLPMLIDAILNHQAPGDSISFSGSDGPEGCFVLDINEHGLVLLQTSPAADHVAEVLFDSPATTLDELEEQLSLITVR